MKGLLEYIKLIPQGIANADKIVEGVINEVKLEAGTLPEDEQAEIVRRRLICASCPFMSENAKKAGNYNSNRIDEHCIQCHCPIKTKTASLTSNCGIEAYNRRHPKAPMELKWEAYIK